MKLLEIIKEGVFSTLMNKSFGAGFKSVVSNSVETLLNKTVDDVAKASGKVTLKSIKNNKNYIEALKQSIGEASVAKYGKKFTDLSASEADVLAKNVQDGMDAHLTDYAKKSGKLADADLAVAKQAVDQTSDAVKAGAAAPRDLRAATKNLQVNQKMSTRVDTMKKVLGGFDQRTRTQIINLLKKDIKVVTDTGEKISQQVVGETTIYSGGKLLKISKEQLKAFPGQVKRVIVNNPVKSALIAAGLTAAVLYLIYGDGTLLTDESGKPIDDNGQSNEFLPCIQELIKSGEGKMVTSTGGQISVLVSSSDYPDGIKFYTNGRVFDVAGRKMGSYKCKQSQVTIAEQSDVETLGREVRKGALVDSDEQVIVDTIIKNSSTKASFENFLSQYKQKYGVDLATNIGGTISPYHDQAQWLQLQNHLKGIGVTFGWDGKKGHPTFDGATTNSSPVNKVGLGNIEITWDTPSGGGGGGGTITPPTQSRYRDCNGKTLPHEFGCRSNQIKELQICLGLPEKYQTGNFGPITKKALEDKGIDTSNGITQTVIDTACGKGGEGRKRETLEPIKTDRLKMSDMVTPKVDMKLPNLTSRYAAGMKIYNDNMTNGTLFERGGRLKYKGDYLSQNDLDELNNYVSALGWKFMKEKDKEDYDVKYVWVKA